jgi:Tfp pilus assembly protein PilP
MALGQPKKRPRRDKATVLQKYKLVWQILLPLAIILIVCVNLLGGAPSTEVRSEIPPLGAVTLAEESVVEILPQPVREEAADEGEFVTEAPEAGTAIGSSAQSLRDPFAELALAGLSLTGVMSSGNGQGVAILDAGGTVYTVSTGSMLGESKWKLIEVQANSATLTDGQSEQTIKMAGEAASILKQE